MSQQFSIQHALLSGHCIVHSERSPDAGKPLADNGTRTQKPDPLSGLSPHKQRQLPTATSPPAGLPEKQGLPRRSLGGVDLAAGAGDATQRGQQPRGHGPRYRTVVVHPGSGGLLVQPRQQRGEGVVQQAQRATGLQPRGPQLGI